MVSGEEQNPLMDCSIFCPTSKRHRNRNFPSPPSNGEDSGLCIFFITVLERDSSVSPQGEARFFFVKFVNVGALIHHMKTMGIPGI